MNLIKSTFAVILVVVVAGCKAEEVQPVSYYENNPQALEDRLQKCELQNNSAADGNCVNANQAQVNLARENDRKGFQSLFGSPPATGE